MQLDRWPNRVTSSYFGVIRVEHDPIMLGLPVMAEMSGGTGRHASATRSFSRVIFGYLNPRRMLFLFRVWRRGPIIVDSRGFRLLPMKSCAKWQEVVKRLVWFRLVRFWAVLALVERAQIDVKTLPGPFTVGNGTVK
jgi:hypothetical protein